MAYTLSNECAKNLCKRTVLLQLIIKNVVTCFFGTHCTPGARVCNVLCSVTDSGRTALHQAAAHGNLSCLKALITAGVLVDTVDSKQRAAHDLAKIYAHKHCARSAFQ